MKPISGSSSLNSKFGVPYNQDMTLNPAWEKANIVTIDTPFTLRIAWNTAQRTKSIRVHKSVAKAFDQAFNNIWTYARTEMKKKYGYNYSSTYYDNKAAAFLRLLKLDLFGGSYNFRKMRSRNTLSYHSYGIAIDIDPGNHVMGNARQTFPDWYVKCWKSAGFAWGGDWHGKSRDSMHFERTSPC
jgi:hypothetical protein